MNSTLTSASAFEFLKIIPAAKPAHTKNEEKQKNVCIESGEYLTTALETISLG